MILSVSRRTDIPTFYSEWFFQRLKEGFVMVRNPIDPVQVSRISTKPDVIDGFVFWTKNFQPMIPRLKELDSYPFYVQWTITPYGKEVEQHLPDKEEVLIPSFQKLSKEIGRQRVVWRYDPIFFSPTYTMAFHKKAFLKMAESLGQHTELCVISFLDQLRSTKKNTPSLDIQEETLEQCREFMEYASELGKKYGFRLETCGEGIDLTGLSVGKGACIDRLRLERLCECPLEMKKDKNQREHCGCWESIDIGVYQSCPSGCLYCYANHSTSSVQRNFAQHDPKSPFLVGGSLPKDVVKVREVSTFRNEQFSFF